MTSTESSSFALLLPNAGPSHLAVLTERGVGRVLCGFKLRGASMRGVVSAESGSCERCREVASRPRA